MQGCIYIAQRRHIFKLMLLTVWHPYFHRDIKSVPLNFLILKNTIFKDILKDGEEQHPVQLHCTENTFTGHAQLDIIGRFI